MKLGVDIPLETKISIKHKKGGKPLLPRMYGLKLISFHFFTSTRFVLDIWNAITDLEFH